MEIRILIRTTDPLTGTATTEGEEPQDFHGWLELLSALSTLTGARKLSTTGGTEALRDPAPASGGDDS